MRAALGALLGVPALAALAELADPGRAIAADWCQCVGYLTNIGALVGGPCWAKDYKWAAGYDRSRRPRKGWVMVVQPGLLGTPPSVGSYWLTDAIWCDGASGAGHVALVTAILATPTDANPSWKLRVRHANWGVDPMYTVAGCSNVSDHIFRVPRSYLANGWVSFVRLSA